VKKIVKFFVFLFFLPAFVFVATILALFQKRRKKISDQRVVWGPVPIINNKYWSHSIKKLVSFSETYTYDFYQRINKRSDWDRILTDQWSVAPHFLKPYIAFLESLLRYDIFVIPCSGYFLGQTPLWRCEAFFLRIARKIVVVIPYGADAYVYRNIVSHSLAHVLQLSYPEYAKRQDEIEEKVSYWVKNADVFMPGIMGIDGMGRWDIVSHSSLCIDVDEWSMSKRFEGEQKKELVIAHAPNHRGFKGTEFLLEAVAELIEEGHLVKLLLLEGLQNSELRRVLQNDVDILVEQLVFIGHGINAVEGMSCGLPVIANLSDERYTEMFKRWGHLEECPIISASPETIKDVLRSLIKQRDQLKEIGARSRVYVEKYHSFDSFLVTFKTVISKYFSG